MELYDFHAHILPHMDHGSTRLSTAVDQLALIHAAGVGTVCATSHFYPQEALPEQFLAERKESLRELLKATAGKPRPRILAGAEVLICAGLEKMDGLHSLCVEGTDILLLEMPFTYDVWNEALYHTIYEIQQMGIRPVLAHVDRYPPNLIDELFEDMGLMGQLNAVSLHHLIKPKKLLHWMDEGYIVALGSDLHGSDPRGYTPYQKVTASMPDRVARIMATTAELLRDAKRY